MFEMVEGTRSVDEGHRADTDEGRRRGGAQEYYVLWFKKLAVVCNGLIACIYSILLCYVIYVVGESEIKI